MTDTFSISEARPQLGKLVRRAAQHEHVVLTDHDTPVAVLIGSQDLEDLEDALALARLERDRALGRGRPPIPHEQARQWLSQATDDAG